MSTDESDKSKIVPLLSEKGSTREVLRGRKREGERAIGKRKKDREKKWEKE